VTEEGYAAYALALYVKGTIICNITDLGYFLVEPKQSKHPRTIQSMVEHDYEWGINSFTCSSSEEAMPMLMPKVNMYGKRGVYVYYMLTTFRACILRFIAGWPWTAGGST